MYSVLELRESLHCKKEVLGRKFKAVIGGHDTVIEFPSLDPIAVSQEDTLSSLVPPQRASKIKREGESLKWGYIRTFPACSAQVEMLYIDFGECKDKTTVDAVIKDAVTRWAVDLEYYCQFLKRTAISNDCIYAKPSATLYVFDGDKRVQVDQMLEIVVGIRHENDFLNVDEIEKAIDFASKNKKLKLECRLLLEAYIAKKERRNREAIFKASCVADFLLSDEIDRCYPSNEQLTLGRKFTYMKKHKIPLPNIDTDAYKELRNDVCHSNKKEAPSYKEVADFIKTTEIIFDYYCKNYIES